MKTLTDITEKFGQPGPDRLRKVRLSTLPKDARDTASRWVINNNRGGGWAGMARWAEAESNQALLYFWCVSWLGPLDDGVVTIDDANLAGLLAPYPGVLQELRYDYGVDRYIEPAEPLDFTRNEALYTYDAEVGF